MMTRPERLFASVLAATALAVAAHDALGVTKTWAPFLGSDDWQFGANWSPSGEPGSADDVIISVDNDLVVLTDDTTLVDSILLIDGADIRTNGHTLNLNDTGNSGIMTLGNGVNLSRLEIDSAAGKSADIDNLQIFDGGQLDMDGGLIEIDSQLVMSAGAQIVGSGTIDYVRGGGTAALLGGQIQSGTSQTLQMNAIGGGLIDLRDASVTVGPAGTVAINSTGGQVDLAEATITVGNAGLFSIDAPLSAPYTGTVTLTDNDSTFEVTQAWTLAGRAELVGDTIGLRTGVIRGGPMTVTGTLELEDAARIEIESAVTFASSSAVILDQDVDIDVVSAELVLEAPAVSEDVAFTGDGVLVAQDGLTVTGDTFVTSRLRLERPNANLNDLVVADGGQLAYLRTPAPNTVSTVFDDARIEVNAGGRLVHAFGDWRVSDFVRLEDGASIGGNGELQMSGFLSIGSGEAVIETDVEFVSTGALSGLIGGSANTTLRVEGDAVYRGAESTVSTIQNGDGRAENGSLLEGELFAIAGSDGATTNFEFRLATTRDTTIAGGASSVGVVNVAGDWDVNGSLYVGGTKAAAAGQGTLNVDDAGGDVAIQETLKVYSTGTVNVDGGDLTTDNLVSDSGATFSLADGVVTVDGGVGRLPDASFAFGGGAGSDPEFNARNGADVAVTSRWAIGETVGTSGRTEVTGLGPLDTPSTLRNTSNGSSADLVLGDAGRGELLVAEGGYVEIGDDVVLGVQATAIGQAVVDGVQNGVRSTLRTRSTSGSAIAVGQAGAGTLDITDGALVEAEDDVFIAQVPGGSGQIHLFQTGSPDNGGFDSQLVVGDDLVVGGGTSSGGFGTLIIDPGGRVDVVEALLIRSASSRMTVSGGEFTTARLIHTLGGELQLFSGRGVIGGLDTNATITIGDGVSATPMELVVASGATSAPFEDVTIEANGVLNIEGIASAQALTIVTGGKLRVAGRLEVDSLTDGASDVELAGGTLAVGGPVIHDVTIVSDGTLEVAASKTLTLGGVVQGDGVGGLNDNLTKTGAGTLVLASANTYGGVTNVTGGTLVAANITGSATGFGAVLVSETGVLSGDGSVGQVVAFSGGAVAPGDDGSDDFGVLSVERLLFNVDGRLEIDLGGTTAGSLHDQLQVDLEADLTAGVLDIDLAAGYTPSFGDSFVILEAAGGVVDTFTAVTGDTLPSGLVFEFIYSSNAVTIEVGASFLPGDFNNDGAVDAADYTVWRDNVGAPAGTLVNDVDGGVVGEAQYQRWLANFGATSDDDAEAVPEPRAMAAMVVGSALALRALRRGCASGTRG